MSSGRNDDEIRAEELRAMFYERVALFESPPPAPPEPAARPRRLRNLYEKATVSCERPPGWTDDDYRRHLEEHEVDALDRELDFEEEPLATLSECPRVEGWGFASGAGYDYGEDGWPATDTEERDDDEEPAPPSLRERLRAIVTTTPQSTRKVLEAARSAGIKASDRDIVAALKAAKGVRSQPGPRRSVLWSRTDSTGAAVTASGTASGSASTLGGTTYPPAAVREALPAAVPEAVPAATESSATAAPQQSAALRSSPKQSPKQQSARRRRN